MSKKKDYPLALTFDFDVSFLDAKHKFVNLNPSHTIASLSNDRDAAFKDSFLQVFKVPAKKVHTSLRDHFVVTKSLDAMLPPLLERYYLNNELVMPDDLITYNGTADWFREIWRVITTARVNTDTGIKAITNFKISPDIEP